MTATDRTPPHDVAAEVAVLGSVLMAPVDALALVGDMVIDDFFIPCHRETWAAIQRLTKRSMPIDLISVGDELKTAGVTGMFDGGWMSWATATAGAVTAWHNVGHHAQLVREKATARRMIALCTDVISSCHNGAPIGEVLETARMGVGQLEVLGASGGPVHIGQVLAETVARINDKASGKAGFSVPYSIRELDDLLDGMHPEETIVVAARPGHGKTAFAGGVAVNASLVGIPSIVFSLEMSRLSLGERILSIGTTIPASVLRVGRNISYDQYKQITKFVGEMEPAPLHIDDRSLPLGRIVGEARRWHARNVRGKFPICLVVVDYLQLIRVEMERRHASREEVVAMISSTMKELAKTLGCPVMVLAQLNRDVEKRGDEPRVSDLRESGAIEQDADLIVFPFRRSLLDNDKSLVNQDGAAELIIGKNRNGPTGRVPAWWLSKTMQFVDVIEGGGGPAIRNRFAPASASAAPPLQPMPEIDGDLW